MILIMTIMILITMTIILLLNKQTQIVREVVPVLRARGFRFVTLGALFETQPPASWRSLGSE